MEDDTVMANFLQSSGIVDPRIERLDDRSKRRNLSFRRKNVYQVVSGNNEYVLLHFSDKYKIIYHNYLKAREVLGRLLQGDRWIIDKKNLLVLLPYFGQVFKKPDEDNLRQIIRFLSDTHESVRLEGFTTPRYISGILSIKNDYFQFSNLRKLVSGFAGMRFELGPGVEDPAFNNFTGGVERAYLVDLDNFGVDINLDYEFGFLAADIDLEFSGYNYNAADFERISGQKVDNLMFHIGYLSRLATIILDFEAGESVSKDGVEEIYHEIEDIGLKLLKTLT